MTRKLLIVASALLLASTLSYCGSGEPGPDAPDAGQSPDAAELRPDASEPDAGPLPGPDAGQQRPDASVPQTPCSTMTLPVGHNLTVTCDGEAMDFPDEMFSYYDHGWRTERFVIYSASAEFAFDVIEHPESCPLPMQLPADPNISVAFSITDLGSGATLGQTGGKGSQGVFRLDGFTLSDPRELSFSCTGCVLTGDGKHSCTLDGTFRLVAQQ